MTYKIMIMLGLLCLFSGCITSNTDDQNSNVITNTPSQPFYPYLVPWWSSF